MIQIDMDMPESCDRCPLCNEDIYVCEVNGCDVEYEWDDGIKSSNCPLTEVKDKSVLEDIKAEITEKMNDCATTSVCTRLGFQTAINVIDNHISRKEQKGGNTDGSNNN